MFSLSDVTGGAKAAQAASAAKLSALQKSASGATHPLAKSAQGKSKAPALPGGKAPKGIAKGKGYTFTMGKLSLLAISLSLMLLGAFTFFSGLMVGAWYFGKTAPVSMASAGIGSQLAAAAGGGAGAGSVSGFEAAAAGGAKKLGLGNIAGSSADVQIQSAIASTNIPGVPSFLQPFVSQVKTALGTKAGSAASQAIQGGVNKAATPKPAATSGGGASSSSSAAGATSSGSASGAGSSSDAGAGSGAVAGSKSSAAKGEFTVQVGAYAAKENADVMLNNLKMKNYDAYVEDGKEPTGQEIYYVRVGHYDSHEMAYTVATNFSDSNIPGATIVKVKDDKKS